MTPLQLARELGLTVLASGDGDTRTIRGIYCCDLLSIVMGRAKADDAWITVMGNINAVAVAVLSDVACIILSEGMTMDDASIEKAKEQDVCILASGQPTFELSRQIAELCGI